MSDTHDQFDEKLSALLRDELASQRGRARAAFVSETSHSRWRIRPMWFATAAMLALLIGGAAFWLNTQPPADKSAPVASTNTALPQHVEQIVWERNLDGGIHVINDQPVRMIRRQTIEHTQWLDADHAVITRTKPREQIKFVVAQPN